MRGSDAGSIGTPSQKNEEPTRVAQKTAIESCSRRASVTPPPPPGDFSKLYFLNSFDPNTS